MKLPELLSLESRASFGGYYLIRYSDQLAPGQILHDEEAHTIYVRGRTDADALIDALNAEAAVLREREDAYFLWRCGIQGEARHGIE